MFYADSTMASAPQLTTTDIGGAGGMCNLLDKLLVVGFGTYTAPVWEIAFTAANKRAYRATIGNRFYLSVDDSLDADYSRVRAFEVMTTATAGTSAFPTTTQVPAVSALWGKAIYHDTLYASNINWWFFGSDTFFYLVVNDANYSTANTSKVYFFGDIPTIKPFAFATIIGGYEGAAGSGTAMNMSSFFQNTSNVPSASCSAYMARSFTGASNSIPVHGALTLTTGPSVLGQSYSSSSTQSQTAEGLLSPVFLATANDAAWPSAVVGRMPNMWNPLNLAHTSAYTLGEYALDTSYSADGKFYPFRIVANTYSIMFEYSPIGDL